MLFCVVPQRKPKSNPSMYLSMLISSIAMFLGWLIVFGVVNGNEITNLGLLKQV